MKLTRPVVYSESLDGSTFVKGSKDKFNLYAILVHSGSSARIGHYYAMVKSSVGVWHRMDDEVV